MLSVDVWYKNENGEDSLKTLKNLKPRRYMCSWCFEKLLKYISNECYWKDINIDSVEVIEICNEKEHWVQRISKEVVNYNEM